MTNLVLELGCEEIPSRFMPGLLRQIKEGFEKAFEQHRLQFESVDTFGTYRRLILKVTELQEKQDDLEQLVKGPPVAIALDDNQALTKAALGFLKKNNCSESDYSIQAIDGKDYITVQRFEAGQETTLLLSTLIPDVIRSLSLPIAMTWGDCSHTFIRPLHWICALFGDELINCSLFSQQADRVTYGHRSLSEPGNFNGKALTVSSSDVFFDVLATQGLVQWNHHEREASIKQGLAQAGQTQPDPQLLNEVTFLVEAPVLLQGAFSSDFLDLPNEVLVECMKKHQRYFPIYKNNALDNTFLMVADNVTDQNKDTIIKGNEKVLVARLKDADYFWQEDRKKSYSDFLPKLDGIVFQKGLGSMHDKCARVATIAAELNRVLALSVPSDTIEKTAYYIKADLVSHMVFEFPSLQGVMGQYYATHSKLDDAVALAIREHYMPVSATADLPHSELGRLFALADRFDTLIASFANGNKATGSQDPLGLRRAANAILAILFDAGYDLSLTQIIDFIYDLLPKAEQRDFVTDFIQQRVKSFLIEQGIRYDLAEAQLPTAFVSLKTAVLKARQLQAFREAKPDSFKQMVEAAVRVHRLAAKADSSAVDASLFEQDVEQASYTSLVALQEKPTTYDDLYNYSKQLTQYFDDVLVMADNAQLKTNRLAFLCLVDQLYLAQASFEAVVLD